MSEVPLVNVKIQANSKDNVGLSVRTADTISIANPTEVEAA